jgi:hypothetical protein
MKILYITQLIKNTTIPINNTISDSILLGLKEIYPTDIVDYPGAWYMDKNEVKKRNYKYKKNFWGNGFTYYDIISDYQNIDRSDILKKINNNYFDFIIYGAIRWSKKFLNEAISSTSKLIFIDGDDDTLLDIDVLKYGVYFKRELIHNDYKNVFPLNCCVPKEKIIKKINDKPINLLAPLIPYRKDTYIYDNQKDYYNMWQDSVFGITYSPNGWWESARYYEMLMNGCIPLILDLENCPSNTLTKLPKKKLINIFNQYSWILNQNFPTKIYKQRFLSSKKFILYFHALFRKKYNAESFILDFPEINEIREELLEYTRNNNTTQTMATDIIKISKNFFLSLDQK